MLLAWEWLWAGKPQDGGSAKLLRDGTYSEEIQRLCWLRSKVIHCRIQFCSEFLDLPHSIAWIMPWLSDFTWKWVLEWPEWMAKSNRALWQWSQPSQCYDRPCIVKDNSYPPWWWCIYPKFYGGDSWWLGNEGATEVSWELNALSGFHRSHSSSGPKWILTGGT